MMPMLTILKRTKQFVFIKALFLYLALTPHKISQA